MKKSTHIAIIGLTVGILANSAGYGLQTNSVFAARELTPNEMKSNLTPKDIKEATPIENNINENTDDIGMPITGGVNNDLEPHASYPNVNNYIYQKGFKHPNITTELHTFSMFNYSTSNKRPSGIVIHYTANPNVFSARAEANYQINGGWKSAFVHTFIDAGSILNIHDTNYGAWGCGPVGNKYFAQFEMVTARNFDDFAKTTSYSAWYTAYLLKKYNLSPKLAQSNKGSGSVWTHHNVTQFLGGTDHTDPTAYFAKYGYDINQFYKLILYYYNGEDTANKGALDKLSATENSVTTSGWHATSKSTNKPYSYLFLMDANTGKEVTRAKITRGTRNDVQKAYPNIPNSARSGFNNTFNITDNMRGKKVYVMSRYSSNSSGNSDFVDYKFDKKAITIPKKITKKSNLETATVSAEKIHFNGWQIDNNSEGKPYSYAILLNTKTGKEQKRIKFNRHTRNDVKKVYPNIYNSGNGGFSVDFPVTDDMRGNTYKVVIRYSDKENGNGNVADVWFNDKTVMVPAWQKGNKGSLDVLKSTKSSSVTVSGWHANSDTANMPYRYLIFMNADTNKEIKRVRIENHIRNDIKRAYPNIRNAEKSGFVGEFTDSRFKGKKIKVISHYAADTAGKKAYIDNWFSKTVKVK